MREAGIGRVLVASLHQAIADILPTRLAFYENWLNAEGLREGTIGLAPLYAVLSFLRQEGDAYGMITTRAGEYAAEWTVQSMPPLRRSLIKAAPAWLRQPDAAAAWRGRWCADSYQGSRAISRLRRGTASVDLRASIFCTVREPVPQPLCGFYAAAFTRLMALFDIGAHTEVIACRGTGEATCVLNVALAQRSAGGGAVKRLVTLRSPRRCAAPGRSSVPRRGGRTIRMPPQSGAARSSSMPFDNVKRDGRIFWLGEASAVLLTDDLNALGADAITRQERLQAFERLQVPPVAALTDATVIRIGQLVGAAQVVVGSLQMENDVLVVRARSIALDTGRVQADVTERGPLPDLFATFERIARRIAPPSATSARRRSSGSIRRSRCSRTTSRGCSRRRRRPPSTISNSALERQPSFDRARLALWDVYAEQGDHAAGARGGRHPSRRSRRGARQARFLAGAVAAAPEEVRRCVCHVQGAGGRAADADGAEQPRRRPAAPRRDAANGPADVLLHEGGRSRSRRPGLLVQPRLRLLAGSRSAGARSTGCAKPCGAIRPTATRTSCSPRRSPRRATPREADARARTGAAAVVDLRRDGQASGRRGACRRGSNASRTRSSCRTPRIETRLAANEQREQAQLATFYLDRGRRLFQQENDRDAIVELNHALYLSPYLAEAHLLLGRIHLRNGRVSEAIDAFKIAVWSAETAEAHARSAKRTDRRRISVAARAEAERALALDPASNARPAAAAALSSTGAR